MPLPGLAYSSQKPVCVNHWPTTKTLYSTEKKNLVAPLESIIKALPISMKYQLMLRIAKARITTAMTF